MNIEKYTELSPAVKKILADNDASDVSIGDIFIGGNYRSNDDTLFRITKMEYIKKKKKDDDEYIKVHYDICEDFEGMEWHQYNTADLKDFLKTHTKLIKSVSEHKQDALDVIEGRKSIDSFKDQSSETLNENTALISKNSKESLIAMQTGLEEKKKVVEMVAKFISFEMERKKQELEKIKDDMYEVVAQFEKKISRIMRVITTIELYLGIDEEIFQLQEGPAASESEPISFRQALLYMDEETGHWESGGLDFSNIDWFQEWLLVDDNYKKLLPEKKGIVVFRPRRYDKNYGNDESATLKNMANKVTYFLIRNGENLYNIYTDKIIVRDRLFPKRDELEKLLKEIEATEYQSNKEEKKEQVEDLTYAYRKRAMLMQGLIDRTDIFKPMAARVNIFNMEVTPSMINFIYDDEALLPTGRLSFDDFKKSINEKISEGSRILLTGHYPDSRTSFAGRFYNKYRESNLPYLPRQSVYTVENFQRTHTDYMRADDYTKMIKKYPDGEIKEGEGYYKRHEKYQLVKIKRDHFLNGIIDGEYVARKGDRDRYEVFFQNVRVDMTIKYSPSDKARSGWGDFGHERKNKVRFRIKPEDQFILNYDQIDLDDIEFYLTNRVDRHKYLYMMPVLEKIKEERLQEFKNEKDFMRFIADRNAEKIEGCTKAEINKRVVEAVIWWKYKNKWKRPIAKDDTLALRMIEKRITSKNYHKLKQIES